MWTCQLASDTACQGKFLMLQLPDERINFFGSILRKQNKKTLHNFFNEKTRTHKIPQEKAKMKK